VNVVMTVMELPCTSCFDRGALTLLNDLEDSLPGQPYINLILADRPARKPLDDWHATVRSDAGVASLKKSAGAYSEGGVRRIIGPDPVLVHSCFGARVGAQVLNLSESALASTRVRSNEFVCKTAQCAKEHREHGARDGPSIYKNTIAYAWAFLRASTLGEYALHLDSDFSLRRKPHSAGWLRRAVALLQHNVATTPAILLEYDWHAAALQGNATRPGTSAAELRMARRYGYLHCADARAGKSPCAGCGLVGAAAHGRVGGRVPRVVALSKPDNGTVCGYTRPSWVTRSTHFSLQAFVAHLPRVKRGWPLTPATAFNEELYDRHVPRVVFVDSSRLGVAKCSRGRHKPFGNLTTC
jgi:hypothetical protein